MTRLVAVAIASAFLTASCAGGHLRAAPDALAAAPPDLRERLRADPYNYFRFVNQEWTTRVCEIFARELPSLPTVQLHGDAHLEQYALMEDSWGLDDFDDSARGPAIVDIVRFLGSIDLAARQHGWTQDRDRLFDRFLEGYRRGLSDPSYNAPEPDVVRWLREEASPPTHEAFLAWAETKMAPMPEKPMKGLVAAMEVFEPIVRRERPDLAEGYFRISRAGRLQMGVGSGTMRKVLIRVQGPSSDPADDAVLEAKALRGLSGIDCLEVPVSQPTVRVIDGNQQVGRLKHDILVAGPELAIPELAIEGQNLRNWWIRSWDSSYLEVRLIDLRSVEDLSALAYDCGVQLGAGSVRGSTEQDSALRRQSLASIATLEPRLRKEAQKLVEELLRSWRELGRGSPSRN